MKRYLTVLFVFAFLNVFGQSKYEIKGFSEKYKGILTIEKGYENEVFKKGNIAIIESKTNAKIVEIDAEELFFDLDSIGNVKTNVLELPYGEQSILIYQDFNFDGIKDLAVMDGQYSCYHGPSFQVYLEIDNKLILSPEFTRLAQEYCGMFQTDYETETIHTMTKSGCCWHQFSTFKVVNNIPAPVLVVEENAMDFPFHSTIIIEWNGKERSEKMEKTIDLEQDGITEVFSFKLTKNQKEVVVFNINDEILNYALLRPDGTVEFSYPIEMEYKHPDFKINKEEGKLMFENQNATYEIYEINKQNKVEKVGILVKVNGKRYDLKGDVNSLKGSLKDIQNVKLDNVIHE
ncbi:hypothetical protein AAG747_04685 [Rapidithrix thailandica]|uniref:VCBS repeat-containing protein n=1 Tax=Rapidithrix thailandica TaxID=413964 RepID=A0AAW9S8Y3_9BACT